MTFAQHQTATQATITIPSNIAFGIYSLCGDDIVNPPAIIIHPPLSPHLVIHQQYPTSNGAYAGTITDNAMQPIANALIYWHQNTLTGTTTSNVNGVFQISPPLTRHSPSWRMPTVKVWLRLSPLHHNAHCVSIRLSNGFNPANTAPYICKSMIPITKTLSVLSN
jgi:hypothetical protein